MASRPPSAVAPVTTPGVPVRPLPTPRLRQRVAEVQALGAELAKLPAEGDAVGHARSVTFRALVSFWEEHAAGRGEIAACPVPVEAVGSPSAHLACSFGRTASRLPHSISGYLLSSLYASLLPERLRAEQGVFFTPPALVERLLELVETAGVDWATARVLDPATGGGAFLAPVAARIEAALIGRGASSSELLDHVADHLFGLELDPFSTWIAHVLLEALLWEHCTRAGRRIPRSTVIGDALQLPDEWKGGFDLVIGNPPYGRITLPEGLRARYDRTLYGHANLYGLFTDLAVRLTRPGGVIGYVTPTSFLGGLYFKKLRRFLAATAPPVFLDFVADRNEVFDGVLQETLLAVYAPGRAGTDLRVHQIRAGAVERRCAVDEVGAYPPPAVSEAPWVLPRTPDTARLIEIARNTPGRLADYGVRVSTGPLVWNRHKIQLADKSGPGIHPLVWAEAVPAAGVFRFQAKKRNHRPYFRLLPGQEHLLQARPCVLVQRTTAKEQQRRLVAAVLPEPFLAEHGGVVVENHLNMVRPVGDSARVGLEVIAALLNSRMADQIFRCMSGSVAVSAFELEALPVPGVDAMLKIGECIRQGVSAEELEIRIASAYESAG